MRAEVFSIDPAGHSPHALHREERIWGETNCYVDLWIELLHTLGFDPVAAAGFSLAFDFEGDQWTFFKFALGDLSDLFGIDVQELALWRPVSWHLEQQIAAGRPVIVEVDSYFLPDTTGTAYRAGHVKTSIAAQMIDPVAERLGYFHNSGYYELEGADYAGIFGHHGATILPPYAEMAKLERAHRLPPHLLAERAAALGRRHFARRPADNPVRRYRQRFPTDLAWLTGEDLPTFHLYAFATLRQCGAAAELAETFLTWLGGHGQAGLEPAARSYRSLAETAKTMQFKLARAVSGRAVDFEPMFETMARDWDAATAVLAAHYGD